MKRMNIKFKRFGLLTMSLLFAGISMAFANNGKVISQVNNDAKASVSNSVRWNGNKAPGDTVFFEDFESGMPSNFILTNYDSLTPFGTYAGLFGDTAWTVVSWAASPSLVATSTSWYTPPGKANDWMIIPITIPDAETIFKWEASSSDAPPFNDGYEVYVSGNSDTTSLVANGPVFSTPGEIRDTLNLVTRSFNLDSLGFRDTTIFVAFRNGSTDKNLLWIDNILVSEASSQLQIIHNSADLAATSVDVYIDDVLTLDSVLFRSATPFLTVPTAFNVKVTPSGAGVGSAVYDQNFTLQSGETYVAIASGIVSATGYNPSPAFDVFPFTPASPTSGNAAEIDVLIFHGSTDAPTVTVNELTTGAILEDGFSFGEYNDAGYLNLPDLDYVLEVTDSAGVQLFYGAPLNTLGLAGSSIVVCASGFVDPSQNSNGAGFGLWVALPSGGPMVELPLLSNPRAQIIHNSADAAAEVVDIYLDGALTLDSVAFRTATAFIDLPNQFTIDIAPAGAGIGSSVYNDDVTLIPGETYVIVANGIASATGYSPAPALGLDVFSMGREQASVSTNTDVLVYHGSTDAPTVDVNETSVPAGNIVSQISYGEFTSDYLELGTQDYVLEVTDNGAVSVSYQAPLGTLGLDSQAIVVLASGFLDPSVNSNGPAFGLWTALASGGDLVELPLVSGLRNDAFNAQISVYPNPATESVQIETGDNKMTYLRIVDVLGREVKTFDTNIQTNGRYDVSDIKKGTYFIQIGSEGQIGALPLIIE